MIEHKAKSSTQGKKWKDRFLSSSFPLEFDVAKEFVAHGFAIDADYSYTRSDQGVEKDFSVDLLATAYPPINDPNEVNAHLLVLSECKYRVPNKKWIFLPEINSPDFFTPYTEPVRVIDKCSAYSMDNSNIRKLDQTISIAYKGIEINISDGQAQDADIKHGINQLRYALPRVINDSILSNAYNHPDDSVPFILCSILITTASLYILDEGTTLNKIQKAKGFNEICKPVPYLILFSDYGPDFESHCKKTCSELLEVSLHDRYKVFKRRTDDEKSNSELFTPFHMAYGFADAQSYYLRTYCTQFLVCNFEYFPQLLKLILSVVDEDLRTVKQIYKKID